MELLAAILISAIVSFVVAQGYVFQALKQIDKICTESIDRMGKISQDFMNQVKEQTEETLNQINKHR